MQRVLAGLWVMWMCCLPSLALAEAVGNANGLLKPISVDELDKVLRERLKSSVTIHDYRPESPQMVMPKVLAAPASMSMASRTNLQEQGVDEADLVKTDGRYLYAVNGKAGVRVFDTHVKATALKQVAAVGFGKGVHVSGIYLMPAQKRLLVIGSSYGQSSGQQTLNSWLSNVYTHVVTVDVSAATKPRIIRQVKLEGDLRATRCINNRLYLVMEHYLGGDYPELYESVATPKPLTDAQRERMKQPLFKAIDQWSIRSALPKYTESGKPGNKSLVGEQDMLMDTFEGLPYRLISLLAFDLDAPETRFESVLYAGSVGAVYISDKAAYLTSHYYSDDPGVDALRRYLPTSDMSAGVIHKFAFRGKGVDYRGSGLILGDLGWRELDSFRMDEDTQGNLRVVSFNWANAKNHSNPIARSPVILTVLAEHPKNRQLVTLSRLPNARSPKPLGKPGEQLYGARLFNDYAYFVTFRQTDPLYVVDMRDPRQLKLAGELVIPGFSDYLHPVTNRLLLGIGKAADAATGRATGWKLSLFDISNPARPTEVTNIQLGGSGSDSPANRHHHAVTSLAVNQNSLTRIALPVRVASETATKTGLYQFEVDHRTRKLTPVGAFHPPVMSKEWDWNETDRSILIGKRLYYYRDGNFHVSDWAKTN